MTFDYFYGHEDAEQFLFYRIPKTLIMGEDFREVSVEAKLLYGLMLDRLSLSMKNGWFDDLNRAYIVYTVEDIIPASEAKPGDIIFFQGTYDTPGASHVGIYVGNGMMIHCGNPIQYASVNSSYFRQHFYCYGRLN